VKAKFLVVSEGMNEFTRKNGQKDKNLVLSCLDQCPSRKLLKNTVDVEIAFAVAGSWAGKLEGKVIEAGLRDAQWFNSRLVFKDSELLSIDGVGLDGKKV